MCENEERENEERECMQREGGREREREAVDSVGRYLVSDGKGRSYSLATLATWRCGGSTDHSGATAAGG